MSSSERKNSVGAPAGADQAAGVEARLASLEVEATRLRAEIAELQDEIRWLAADEAGWSGDPAWLSRGWLYRGWVRASLLLLVVGVVTLVSVPYFLHLLEPSPSTAESSAAPASTPPTATETAGVPATTHPREAASPSVPQPEFIPAPARVSSDEIPAPTHVTSSRDRRPRPIVSSGAPAKQQESP